MFIDTEKTISKMSVNSGKLYKEKFTEDCLVKNFDKVLNQFFYKLSYFFDNIFNFFIIHILF